MDRPQYKPFLLSDFSYSWLYAVFAAYQQACYVRDCYIIDLYSQSPYDRTDHCFEDVYDASAA